MVDRSRMYTERQISNNLSTLQSLIGQQIIVLKRQKIKLNNSHFYCPKKIANNSVGCNVLTIIRALHSEVNVRYVFCFVYSSSHPLSGQKVETFINFTNK